MSKKAVWMSVRPQQLTAGTQALPMFSKLTRNLFLYKWVSNIRLMMFYLHTRHVGFNHRNGHHRQKPKFRDRSIVYETGYSRGDLQALYRHWCTYEVCYEGMEKIMSNPPDMTVLVNNTHWNYNSKESFLRTLGWTVPQLFHLAVHK